MESQCPFCEYTTQIREGCNKCPYQERYEHDCQTNDSPFTKWAHASNTEERKRYAGEFLLELLALNGKPKPDKPKPKPEPEWMDVTEECKVRFDGNYVTLLHEGLWLLEMGLKTTRLANYRTYRIEDMGQSNTPNTFHYFKVMKKVEGGEK